MPSRRSYLGSLAAAGGLAGCLGGDAPPGAGNGSPVGTDTGSPTGTDSSSTTRSANGSDESDASDAGFDASSLSVYDAAVQYSYRSIVQVDWNDVTAADGQFVFVGVDAEGTGDAPARAAFTLGVGDDAYEPIAFERHPPYDPEVDGVQYAPDDEYDPQERGWLCFETPARLRDPLELRVDRGGTEPVWEVPATDLASAPPPEWEFEATALGTVAPDERFDLDLRATNVGTGPGVFRGAVNFSYPLYRPEGFDVELVPGESGSATVEATSEGADSGQTLSYGIRTPLGRREVSVDVATATDPASTATPTRSD